MVLRQAGQALGGYHEQFPQSFKFAIGSSAGEPLLDRVTHGTCLWDRRVSGAATITVEWFGEVCNGRIADCRGPAAAHTGS
jgi:hypothetical protein